MSEGERVAMKKARAVKAIPEVPSSLAQEMLTERDLAKLLDRSIRTLRRMQQNRTGPPFVEIGHRRLYRRTQVFRWLLAHEKPCLNRKMSEAHDAMASA
jgi:hypothetical protein